MNKLLQLPGSSAGYRRLRVWQHGMKIVKDCYDASAKFPVSEQFGLTSQIRRAAVSIPSNLAEGAGRSHIREFLNFVSIASGSLNELETLLILAFILGYLPHDQATRLLQDAADLAKMLNRLRISLERKVPENRVLPGDDQPSMRSQKGRLKQQPRTENRQLRTKLKTENGNQEPPN
jgi:four helix bundle protein